MSEDIKITSKRRRRSTKISERLEAARRRNVEQLAEQRRREAEVDGALAEFVAAGEDIAAADRAAEEKISAMQRKIDGVRADVRAMTAASRDRQARAALRIHEVGGRTVEQVSELLEIGSVKETRRILATARMEDETVPEAWDAKC
ncbi:hypothetical protein GCM10027271_46180 [Saccharopolyspora gloriosae]|uniref:Phage shock protein A n=1 Tax=Saccharopolyspora gloriosae TaxID=455344 RepID=A0A840NLT8_9PSEU|nr:hypothetical protein [Saccharopolyspora gloriosae]MBB5070082.1 phage shock protein A [Saccharopolyspora gloriosae]